MILGILIALICGTILSFSLNTTASDEKRMNRPIIMAGVCLILLILCFASSHFLPRERFSLRYPIGEMWLEYDGSSRNATKYLKMETPDGIVSYPNYQVKYEFVDEDGYIEIIRSRFKNPLWEFLISKSELESVTIYIDKNNPILPPELKEDKDN